MSIFNFIAIDSLYNALLFIIIFSIKLSKYDKSNYYQSLLLPIHIRYLFLLVFYIIELLISEILLINIDISILANPLIIYFSYRNEYIRCYISKFYKKVNNILSDSICYVFHKVLLFLIKIILGENTNIKLVEIKELYNKIGYDKVLDFFRSLILACLYEYISVRYKGLSYLFTYNSNFGSNYEKKQYILGLINDKNWVKFMDTKTISIFFDIYKTSNSRQISEFIQQQINRLKFTSLCLFSSWSIVGYLDNVYIIPILYFYYLKDIWISNYKLYLLLSIISILNVLDYFIVLLLFSINYNYYNKLVYYILLLDYKIIGIDFLVMLFVYMLGNNYYYSLFYLIVFSLLKSKLLCMYISLVIMGYISNYNFNHLLKVLILWLILVEYVYKDRLIYK